MEERIMKTIMVMIVSMLLMGTAFAGQFSDKSVKGCYGFSFHGTTTHGSVAAPTVAVGRLCNDGKGMVTELQRTLHIPGAILSQKATGVYTVEPSGWGWATFDVTMNGQPFSKETFHFVVTDNGKILQFISGAVMSPDGSLTESEAIISGTAIKQ
jgi:hypothetical protein